MSLNAPDVILDLLVANAGPVPARSLARAAALLGIGPVAMRVALSRLVADRKVRREGRGRYAIGGADAGVLRAVSDWRRKRSVMAEWAGDWFAVQDAQVARSDKVSWRRHRLALDLWGFRQLRDGLHLRPANLVWDLSDFDQRLREVGLSGDAITLRLSALTPAMDREARQLWQGVQEVAEDRRLLALMAQSTKAMSRATLDDAVRSSFLIGREVIAVLVKDPLLPASMLNSKTRERLFESAERYQDLSREIWQGWLRAG